MHMSDNTANTTAAEALAPLHELQVRVLGEADAPPHGRVRDDLVAAEVPVALVFNGISHAVMMATPQELEDFALGFALSEGIVDSADDCYGIDVAMISDAAAGLPEGVQGVEVQLDIASACFERLKGRRRSLTGRTGCGVCGVESMAALDLSPPPSMHRDWIERIDLPTVLKALAQMAPRQQINAKAGSLHAAAWANIDGDVTEVTEDVGRHNALDKLIGARARNGRLHESGFVVMTSRGSHELVRKCARVGIGALATVSAPTVMGVRMAELSGIRLWGLCRTPRGVLYAGGNAPTDGLVDRTDKPVSI